MGGPERAPHTPNARAAPAKPWRPSLTHARGTLELVGVDDALLALHRLDRIGGPVRAVGERVALLDADHHAEQGVVGHARQPIARLEEEQPVAAPARA